MCSIWRRHLQERATQTWRRTEAITSRSSSNVPVNSKQSDCSRETLLRILQKAKIIWIILYLILYLNFILFFVLNIFYKVVYEDDAFFICNAFKYIVIVTRCILFEVCLLLGFLVIRGFLISMFPMLK